MDSTSTANTTNIHCGQTGDNTGYNINKYVTFIKNYRACVNNYHACIKKYEACIDHYVTYIKGCVEPEKLTEACRIENK